MMKRLFLTLCLMIMAIAGTSAFTSADILGEWRSNFIKHEPTEEMPMTVTARYVFEFKADGSVVFRLHGNYLYGIDDIFIEMYIVEVGTGTYSIAGDSISINIDGESVKTIFNEDNVKIIGCKDEALAKSLHDTLYNNTKSDLDQMADAFTEPMVLNKVTVTSNTKFVCTMEDEFMTFKRVQQNSTSD